jgi:hypothetical protein
VTWSSSASFSLSAALAAASCEVDDDVIVNG